MFIYVPPETFDPEKHFDAVPLCQGVFFRRWQQRYGRKTLMLVADDPDGSVRAYIQCVAYTFPLIGSVWVATRGPLGEFDSPSVEAEFYRHLIEQCLERDPKTAHVRVQRALSSHRVRAVPAERTPGSFVYPISERILPISGPIESIVALFSKSTRQIIRRYEDDQSGIRFHAERTDFKSHLQDAHDLITRTATLRGFEPHPLAYYEALFDELNANPEYGTLLLGYLEGISRPVSVMLLAYSGSEAYHLFSGNAPEGYEKNMPTLMMHMGAREAKSQGLDRYNMGGVSSEGRSSLDNLSIFKGKFGGDVVTHHRPVDLVVSPWRYSLFRFSRLKPVFYARRLVARGIRAIAVRSGDEEGQNGAAV